MVFLLASSETTVKAQSWTADMYDKYTVATFQKFEPASKPIDFKNIDIPLLNAAIFYETNRQRQVKGLKLLKHADKLEMAAQIHSQDMVKRNFFSHTSKVSERETLSDRMTEVGMKYNKIAENIAVQFGIQYQSGKPIFVPKQNGGYFSYKFKGEPIPAHTYLSLARAVIKAWLASPGHRANIYNVAFEFVGVGSAYFQNKDFYKMNTFKITQNFARVPRS